MQFQRIALFVVIWLQAAAALAQGVTTYAGTGTAGFNGDGPTATAAQLYLPIGIATDSLGNVYIADSNNHRVRKVTPAGGITTVAGTGTADVPATAASLAVPTAVAVDAAGNLYIADTFNHRIQVAAGTDGDDRRRLGVTGPARQRCREAPRCLPRGVAPAAGA